MKGGDLRPGMTLTARPLTAEQESRALIKAAGAEMDDNSGPGELFVNVWVPPPSVWRATMTHSIRITFYTDRAAGWRALLADLREGITRCPEPDCDEGCR